MKTGSFIGTTRHFQNLPHHADWGGINYSMETGKIIRYNGQAGVVAGEPLPTGNIPCWFGNETMRQEIKLMPFELVVVDLIDLTPTECEGLLPLMQALVFRLKDDQKAF